MMTLISESLPIDKQFMNALISSKSSEKEAKNSKKKPPWREFNFKPKLTNYQWTTKNYNKNIKN